MLRIRDLIVRYGATLAVDGVDLEVADGEVLALLGPSGCGKSSLLRAVSGLEPHGGTVELDGVDLGALRPDQRGVGLMFQDHALFPHRNVRGNVAFGLRMRGWDAERIDARIAEVLDLVGMAGYGERPVDELSGGEQQRVALARAVAPGPRLLMLDEPLGSVDRALRDRLLTELPELFAQVDASVVYVTHDQDEALAVADRVVVMRAGRIEQEGTPEQLWREPGSAFVARFLGLRNLVDAEVVDGHARTAAGRFPVGDAQPEGPALLVLLPDALRLAGWRADGPLTDDGEPRLAGRVTARTFAGDHFVARVATAAGDLHVPIWAGTPPRVGDDVTLTVDPTAVVVLSEVED